MNFWVGLLTGLYFLIALGMCSFILLMNEDNEGMGAPSMMSPVRSSQKGSVLQQIIWILIALFFGTCVLLNRLQSRHFLVNVLLQKKPKDNMKNDESAQVVPKVTVDEGSKEAGVTARPQDETVFTNITDEVLQNI